MTPVRQTRVAIVGLGPKGLFALERLSAEIAARPDQGSWAVHLFEPHPVPGAGPVYDPGQPEYLRMNFANRHIDLWSRQAPELAGDRPTLVQWLARHHPEHADPDGYAPRGVVGEYLNDGYREVIRRLGERAEVVEHRRPVETVERVNGQWRVGGDEDAGVEVDEALIATGHDSRGAEPPFLEHPRVVPAVFPVAEHLPPGRFPRGVRVAIRGFGLTALDAVLALTEDHHPECLIPYSRSGRPMLPKIDSRRAPPVSGLDSVWQLGSQALGRAGSVPEITEALVEISGRALATARTDLLPSSAHRETGELLSYLVTQPSGRFRDEGIVEALGRGLAEAVGEVPWSADRALGETWRKTYPVLVGWVAAGGVEEAERPAFHRLAREMERLAFGPPAVSAARLLDLLRSGRVDPAMIDGPVVEVEEEGVRLTLPGPPRTERTADVLLDAVLAPPGAAPPNAAVFTRLLAAGYARLAAGTHGIEVTAEATAVGQDGSVTPGLAVIGRPTEGSVLGNDTLSRTLHEHPARWAAAVVARARRRRVSRRIAS